MKDIDIEMEREAGGEWVCSICGHPIVECMKNEERKRKRKVVLYRIAGIVLAFVLLYLNGELK